MLPVNPVTFPKRNTMSFYSFNFDANLFKVTIFCVQNGANILLFVVVFNNNKG